MKRIYTFLIALTFSCAGTDSFAGVTPLRLGLMKGYQIFPSQDVWGLDLGLVRAGSYASNRSVGVQLGIGSVANKESIGLSAALYINGSPRNTGIQVGGMNGGSIHGIRFGVFNGPLFSDDEKEAFGFKSDVGLQFGIVNMANPRNRQRPTWGLQAGLLNYANEMHGAQIGILNAANRLSGIQIGLINMVVDRKGPMSVLPFFNAGF